MAATRTIGNRLAPPRFILFFAVLIVAGGLCATWLPQTAAVMAAFDVAALVFLVGCLPLFRRKADEMRKSASNNDANRVILLVLTAILSLVILVTIAGELTGEQKPTDWEKMLVVATLVLAWAFANSVYALHYAHLYYTGADGGKDLAGLDFPGDRAEPDYFDFVYFSFTLGVALQTSDVCITSPRIRRVVTAHCVAAFVYNLGVLALAVSVLGSR